MRQHCPDGSFRLCRWRAHREALSEDSGPEALSTHGQYFALQVFYAILQPIAGELSANCCRTITMTRYTNAQRAYVVPPIRSMPSPAGCFASIDRTAATPWRVEETLSLPSMLFCGIIFYPSLRNHKTFLMSASLSRRFSCMVRLRLLLLHTVRMTWRLFPRFLLRGYLREYLCRQSCLQHD
jgi:hypothetical protein